jgi:hypothetical protein
MGKKPGKDTIIIGDEYISRNFNDIIFDVLKEDGIDEGFFIGYNIGFSEGEETILNKIFNKLDWSDREWLKKQLKKKL